MPYVPLQSHTALPEARNRRIMSDEKDFRELSDEEIENYKFMISAHSVPLFKNVPDDRIYHDEMHEADKCSYSRCVCMCPDCVMAHMEEQTEDIEKPPAGSLDYEELREALIRNRKQAKLIREVRRKYNIP